MYQPPAPYQNPAPQQQHQQTQTQKVYFGSGKVARSGGIRLRVCVSDMIAYAQMKQTDMTKQMISLWVNPRTDDNGQLEPDQYGNTHSVSWAQPQQTGQFNPNQQQQPPPQQQQPQQYQQQAPPFPVPQGPPPVQKQPVPAIMPPQQQVPCAQQPIPPQGMQTVDHERRDEWGS